MAAPAPTVRGTPAGIRIDDGYRALITFATKATVAFWEKTVKPPGIDGGDSIDTTTMHNSTWRTMAARALKTLTECSSKVSYDTHMYSDILALINVETTITVLFSNGDTLAFYGFLKSIEFDDLVEGTQPEATITITPTNYDPTNNVEAGPTLTEA